jgi:probable FeS assembly SUF system protein SufT
MQTSELISLTRECEAIGIPSGVREVLPQGTTVRIMQSLGSGYTVVDNRGYMLRIDARDADAMGLAGEASAASAVVEGSFKEDMVWDQLKTVYDPEIPVNIVDLGLIYDCAIADIETGGKKIDIKMSMTAPGCGMGSVLKADVESKLARLPEVKDVHVEVVFDPPWNPSRMSEAAKLKLGFDLDYGDASLPTFGRSPH